MSKYKQSFLKGTLILLAAGIINRVLGFVPRMALPRIIGAEGVGLYQMGYPFLLVILTMITGGIPLAVAKLVSEAASLGNEKQVQHILKSALLITSVLSALLTAICMLAAPWITSHLFTDARVYYTFMWMSPIIGIVGISSVYKGYFQGRQNMIPTAASQVGETIVRIVFVLYFAYALLPFGIKYAAAGAMIGVLAGEVFGLFIIAFYYLRSYKGYRRLNQVLNENNRAKSQNDPVLGLIGRIALPVTASRMVGSLSYFLESIAIVQSLAIAGVATVVATTQYGMLQGMIIPILLLPSALTYSLSVSLVPALSEAAAKNDMQTIHARLNQSLRLALVTGAPFAVIMYILADPLCIYLFNNTEVGAMLKMMAPVAVFIYFQSPLQAALQALDKPGQALVNTLIGAAIKLVLIYLLATRPYFGILGAIMAINMNIVIVTLLHWSSVARLLKFSMKQGDFFKVGASMLVMGILCLVIFRIHWTNYLLLRFIMAIAASSLVYLWCVAQFKLIHKYELRRLPWFGKKM